MASRARPPTQPVTRDIDEQTGVGEVFMRGLLRAQLRHALAVIGVVVLVLGTLPALFIVLPALSTVGLLTVPLPWLLLGVIVYPLLYAAAWWYVRAAEHTEAEFAELVRGRDDQAAGPS